MADATGVAEAVEQPALVNLFGESGMGKTTLALAFAYGRISAYPCVLYYDLRGSGIGTPADPAEVLVHFARMLGLPSDQTAGDVPHLAAAVRNATRRRRLLMVLDDAYSAAQIVHLLPSSPTSIVIVTSRRQLIGRDLPDFVPVRLGRFTQEVSVELLSRSIDPAVLAGESAAVRELVDLCGRTPLILKVAAGRIGTWRRAHPVASFVGRVRSPGALAELHLDGDRLVEAIYDVCYRELTEAEARAYRRLALHPGPDFATAVAAAMLGVDEEPAADVLADLERVDLLDRIGADRYRFHHLIGEHARRCAFADAGEPERRSVVAAAVTYYRRFAVGRGRSMSRRPLDGPLTAETETAYAGSGAAARAAADLEIEYLNLRAAVAAAADLELDAECVQLCFALRPWLYDTDRTAELVELAMIGSAAAARGGDRASRMHMLGVAAIAAEKHGYDLSNDEYRSAVAALHEARRLAAELGDHRVAASTFEWEGLLAEQHGDLGAALRHLGQASALVAARLTGDEQRRAAALLYMHIGRVTLRIALGKTPADVAGIRTAIDSLHEAERYFAGHETWVNSARIDHLLGEAMLATDRLDEAERRLTSAADALRVENFASQGVKVLPLLAEAHRQRDDRPQAQAAWREAAGYAKRLGRPDLESEFNRQADELGE